MFPDTHITDPPLQNRTQFSNTYNHHHHPQKQWNGMDNFRNEVYDAEHLLEDLGFAGSLDPTIPERFIPSLLNRVASMPKTALWCLNQRILHTLILHKRKEQRRRLFRYSSVNNKEIIESRSRVSDILHSHAAEGGCGKEAGLVRALTGPTDCSEKDILSVCLSAFQSSTIPPFENAPIPNTPAVSSSTLISKPECPISICIESPEDQRPMPKDVIGGCVLPDAAKKITNNSRKNESNESSPEIAKDCNLAQSPYITSDIDRIPHQSTIPRSYAKFSKDQRRMVLQRSHAIGRPRSASEPILIPAHSCRNKFPPIAHSLHEEDGIKSPNDGTLLPCSSQNQSLSLPHTCNCTSFLRYLHATFSPKVNYLKNAENIYINTWKRNSRLSGDNHAKELCIARKVERPTLTRQGYVSSTSNSSQNLPGVVFSLESDSFKNDIFKLNLPLEFIKFVQTFSTSASAMNSKPLLIFRDCYAIPGSSLRFDMSNLESTVFDCFSILVRRNYLCAAETDNEGGGKTLKKKKSLFAYLSSSQSENSNQNIISKYLLMCHDGRDNVKFSYPPHGILNSKLVALEQLDTPPMFIMAAMADNFSGRCDPHPVFLSGFNIDVGHNGSDDIRFQSAVTLQFHDTKKSEAGPSIENAAGNTVEKSADAERKEPPSHSFFRKATKELIELQEYIKKAKANRESASAELRVLQDILLASNTGSNAGGSSKINDDDDRELNTFSEEPVVASKLTGSVHKKRYGKQDGQSLESCIAGTPSVRTEKRVLSGADSQTRSEIEKKSVLRQLRKNILRVEQRHCEDVSRMEKELRLVRNESSEDNRRDCNRVDALQLMILQLQNEMLRFQQALSDLQKKTRTNEEQTSAPNENEIRSKIQQELEEECNSRVFKMEAKLKVAEQQLRVLREENEDLRQQLLLDSRPNSTHHQPTSKHTNTSSPVMNGFTVNGDIPSNHVEEKNENEEKLREELQETEERADRLNLMLDEKVLELNRLQLSLSKRTKEMVLLERAYLQLVCQVYRSGHASRKMNDISTSPLPNGKLAEEPP